MVADLASQESKIRGELGYLLKGYLRGSPPTPGDFNYQGSLELTTK